MDSFLHLAIQQTATLQPSTKTDSKQNFHAVILTSRWNNSCSSAMSVRADQLYCLRYEMSEKHKQQSAFMFVFLNPEVMKCTQFTASSNQARHDSYISPPAEQKGILGQLCRKDASYSLGTSTFKAKDLLYIPPALTYRNCVFCPQCIYVFCVDLKTNSDYVSIQH